MINKKSKPVSSNLRALRLALTVSDQLLSMGVSSSGVVSRALDITERFCEQPVHIDISSNLIMLSQIRNLESEPLTLFRPVVARDANNRKIQSIQYLVFQIRSKQLTLNEAEAELTAILKNPRRNPNWVLPVANAFLAASIVLMFTSNWRIILLTFIINGLVQWLIFHLTRRDVAPFFRHAIAGFFVTMGAAAIGQLKSISFFNDLNLTLIVIGGIFMLMSGLAIVASLQDAIEEYYLSASARLIKVSMFTSGIVVGVSIGLYTAGSLGIGIAVSPDTLGLNAFHFQLIGGALAALGLSVAAHTRPRAVIWSALMGGLAVIILFAVRWLGVSTVAASGVSALVIGFLAKMFSRDWHTPSSGAIAAGIIPLTPGLALFTAMFQLEVYPPGDPLFYKGLGSLFIAGTIGLSIAAGATFGIMLARPLNQRQTQIRNFRSFENLVNAQLRLSQQSRAHLSGLASIAIKGSRLLKELVSNEANPNDKQPL